MKERKRGSGGAKEGAREEYEIFFFVLFYFLFYFLRIVEGNRRNDTRLIYHYRTTEGGKEEGEQEEEEAKKKEVGGSRVWHSRSPRLPQCLCEGRPRTLSLARSPPLPIAAAAAGTAWAAGLDSTLRVWLGGTVVEGVRVALPSKVGR